MSQSLPVPEACSRTLETLFMDPLDPGPEVEAHLTICRACSEARVAYLAQEDSPEGLAPADYFERLPDRVLRKLPVRTSLQHRFRPFTWAAAAALLLAVGGAAFWAGQLNRTPLVEATLPRQPEVIEATETDTPFHDREEEAAQLQALSPEEMKALLRQLDPPKPSAR